MKLLVVGAAGQLGSTFADTPGHDVIGLTRADVDVTDQDALLAVVERIQPDVLVNCTAYNNVDGAEDDASTALAVNAIAVRSMAAAAARTGATFVHYSTDFVFDGEASSPYAEEDRTRPVSVYGCSKLLGEWFARDAPRWYVLRVESLFGGRQARSSVDKIAAALRDGRSTPVFADRVVTPSYVDDVRDATLALLARDIAVRRLPLREQRAGDLGRRGPPHRGPARRRPGAAGPHVRERRQVEGEAAGVLRPGQPQADRGRGRAATDVAGRGRPLREHPLAAMP